MLLAQVPGPDGRPDEATPVWGRRVDGPPWWRRADLRQDVLVDPQGSPAIRRAVNSSSHRRRPAREAS